MVFHNLNNEKLSEEVSIINESPMSSEISPLTTQQTMISTQKTIANNNKSKKPKQNDKLREALDTLKDISYHVQDNEFTLFGQQVGTYSTE